MASLDGVQSSDSMDPLHRFSGLSLFPLAFKDVKKNVSSCSGNSDDLNFIHETMKLKDLKSPNKLSEQANTIIDGVSELLNTNFAGVGPDEKLNVTRNGNPRDRRPGLGLKRPRFSLRPNSRQPSACLEPSLNIDELADPEEYFLACEKLENVRKELNSQNGPDPFILDENCPLRAEQRRRPGLLGKSVSYKHLGPLRSYGNVNKSVASQETLEQDLFCSDHSLQQLLSVEPGKETSSVQLMRPETENLLNELLSDKCENLDADGALTFLQDHLQIKPIEIETLSLPAFPVVGKSDFIDVIEKSKKPKKVLSDLQNFLKSAGVETPMKDQPVEGSPISSTASPTPPKSPFASIFLTKNTCLKSSEKSHDTLMSFEPLPSKSISHCEQFDQRSNQFDVMKDVSDLDMMESTQNEHAELTVDNRSSPEIIACDSRRLSNEFLEMDTDHARRVDNESILITPNEMQENVEDVPQEPLIHCPDDANVTKDSPMICTNEQTEGPNDIQENVEDQSYGTERDKDLPTSGTSKSIGAQSVFLHGTEEPVKSPVKVAGQVSKQNIEGIKGSRRTSKRLATNGGLRTRNSSSRRQSLADAGTSWTSGVRRSKRIKMRPLEYWKGERCLYGRVHKSLPSLIGIKYLSPTKGGDVQNPTFRVKSFSDEHRELVEIAALH